MSTIPKGSKDNYSKHVKKIDAKGNVKSHPRLEVKMGEGAKKARPSSRGYGLPESHMEHGFNTGAPSYGSERRAASKKKFDYASTNTSDMPKKKKEDK